MTIGFGSNRYGKVEGINVSMNQLEERIGSEDMVTANRDNSFNKFCYERKKTNEKQLERDLESRMYHQDLQNAVFLSCFMFCTSLICFPS